MPRLRDAVSVRSGDSGDLAAVVHVSAASPEAPAWTDRHFLQVLCSELHGVLRRMAFVAQQDGDVVGFAVISALCFIAPPEAELENIAVLPERRGCGAGRALLHEAILWAKQQGATSLRLEVRRSNARALRLYAACGFAACGTRTAYYQNPVEDAVCMNLSLAVGCEPMV